MTYKSSRADLDHSYDQILEAAASHPVGYLGYDVVFATNNYHVIRNRKNKWNREDSLTILPNRSTISETKLPRVKMNL